MTLRFVRYCIAFLVPGLISSVEAAERRYPLADRGAIIFVVPDGWREEVRSSGPSLPPTIVYSASSGAAFQVLVTPIWPFKPNIPKPSVEGVRESARRAADSVKSQAVESEIKIEELKGREAFGSYFSVTDRAPKPGEYKYMTQGMLGLADLRVTFTILTNDEKDTIVPRALDMLKGAKRESVGGTAR